MLSPAQTLGETVDGTSDATVGVTPLPEGARFDPGPAAPESAIGEYNVVTGQFVISVDNVVGWWLISLSKFTGPDLEAVKDLLLAANPNHVVDNAQSRISEFVIGSEPFTYTNVNLGRVVEPGLDVSEFRLDYATLSGPGGQVGEILVVPEPGTVWLVAIGAFVLMILFRRPTAAGRLSRQGG